MWINNFAKTQVFIVEYVFENLWCKPNLSATGTAIV